MLEYAKWKYCVVGVVLLLAVIFALPNVFGNAPALQLAHRDHSPIGKSEVASIALYLHQHGVQLKSVYMQRGALVVQFADVSAQLRGQDLIDSEYQGAYIHALSLVPRTPGVLRDIGLKPMPLGLDLQGGLDLLYEVDVRDAVNQDLATYGEDATRALAAKKITVRGVQFETVGGGDLNNGVRINLPLGTDPVVAQRAITNALQGLAVTTQRGSPGPAILAVMSPQQIRQREDYAIEQNVTILRNRVNQLGVSEPIVQRQGLGRIDVQLPGIQNAAEVKNILGRMATLEFRLQDMQVDPTAAREGRGVPLGDKLYINTQAGVPVLLKRQVLVTGDQLTNAVADIGQEGPEVEVTLNGRAGRSLLSTTEHNVGNMMAVVLITKKAETSMVRGRRITREVSSERVITDDKIQGVFGERFQITGLTVGEAHDLAILLRSGSFKTPIYLVEERVIGPSLGRENIRKGIDALAVGLIGVLVFMAIYYKVFGLIADVVLIANVILLAALLSLMHSTLSLPGIAGIILTVGIAVDANVLIYERIREEVRKGVPPHAAIRAGFEKAISAIADSNITALIAGVVLWTFGSGAIRGFAVVLTLGIGTSMFTSLLGSRALVTLLYGRRRRISRLLI
ncbi:MAG TPA: protein translocase subunit SecD [Steroidobacteraceae bacterium]|nr:protein translocase subunit SecD [Steroidobacteraceae bacterium]